MELVWESNELKHLWISENSSKSRETTEEIFHFYIENSSHFITTIPVKPASRKKSTLIIVTLTGKDLTPRRYVYCNVRANCLLVVLTCQHWDIAYGAMPTPCAWKQYAQKESVLHRSDKYTRTRFHSAKSKWARINKAICVVQRERVGELLCVKAFAEQFFTRSETHTNNHV